MDLANIDLGYLETPEHAWMLHRSYFPSKVGGKPAWLHTGSLPNSELIKCKMCKSPLAFLLQLYAPNDEKESCFHRTLFVFCCKSGLCYKAKDSSPFKVLRCCLPRKNTFYDYNPPSYDEPTTALSSKKLASLCVVCGCVGKKLCSRCKLVNYCGKEHQVLDWKRHKASCGTNNDNDSENDFKSDFLFPEFELVIERENVKGKADEVSSETNTSCTGSSVFSEEELDRMCSGQKEDPKFVKFKKRLSFEPDQVVRYKRNGSPLWCSSYYVPLVSDIPPCRCGAKRSFEFQIMPHLLNHLNVDTTVEGPTVDWGTVSIYTCSEDCVSNEDRLSSAYLEEFVWKQTYAEQVPRTT